MNMHLKLGGLALGLALAAGTLSTVPAAAQDWSGFYFGKHVGCAVAHRTGCTSWSFSYIPEDCEDGVGPIEIDTDYTGWAVGAQLGFNVQNGNIVYGVEGAGSWMNLDSVDQFDGVNGINALFTGTGRIGVASGNVLFYGEAGVAVANFEYGPNAADCAFSSTLFGGVVGVGIEAMFSDRLSGFVEVNHSRFAPSEGICGAPASPYSYSETQTNATVAKVGINVHTN
jgi:outer membrane immunogenic protein